MALYLFCFLYLPAASGYGAWRGQVLWSDWVIWAFLLPPFAWSCFLDRKILQTTSPIRMLVVALLFAVGIGAVALAVAVIMAELTSRYWNDPATRTVVGVVISLAIGGWALLQLHREAKKRRSQPAENSFEVQGPSTGQRSNDEPQL
jgi:hypothetical protein